MQLAVRLNLLASMHGHPTKDVPDRWQAYLLLVSFITAAFAITHLIRHGQIDVIQSNKYDCGIWVLAGIAAVLRGYDVTDFVEEDMVWFRRFVAGLIMSIPSSN
jgi:Ulp1 family protease